jgi:hypothetical protein
LLRLVRGSDLMSLVDSSVCFLDQKVLMLVVVRLG